jgi:hypothetical protein
MLYFPQLTSGAVSQYPIIKHNITRTVSNQLEDGSTIRMSDGAAAQVFWELAFSGLSAAEWNSIEQLFETVQGGLATFTFLDPAGNLLSWSEDYSQAAWTVDPLLVHSAGAQDPLGETSATRFTNTAQASQQVVQHVTGPASYQYCFSVYLRSDAQETVSMRQSSSSGATQRSCVATPQWTRFVLSANLRANDDGVAFGISLLPGSSVDVFGPQVEAQPAAGRYKKTVDRPGAYTNCRFADDSLTLSTQGPNQNSGIVRLVSNLAAM